VHGVRHEVDPNLFWSYGDDQFHPAEWFKVERYGRSHQELYEESLRIHDIFARLGMCLGRPEEISGVQTTWAWIERIHRPFDARPGRPITGF
jgi:hypothetical protein